MSRGAPTVKQGDITRALRAVVKAGVKGDWRVEIDRDGKIIVIVAEPASAPDTETSADVRKLL